MNWEAFIGWIVGVPICYAILDRNWHRGAVAKTLASLTWNFWLLPFLILYYIPHKLLSNTVGKDGVLG